jgi:hypothetical protein
LVAARPPVKIKGSGIKGHDPVWMGMKIKMKRVDEATICGIGCHGIIP